MSLIERIGATCCRRALIVVVAAVAAALVTGIYIVDHFRIDTNSERLVSQNTDWRQREIHYDKLFPQQNNLILVVVDGATPERAEYGAAALTERLERHRDLLPLVRRPD